VGECDSFANSQRDAESFVVSVVNSVRHISSVTLGDICVSHWQPGSEYAPELDVYVEELTHRDTTSRQETKAVNATYWRCS